MAFNHERLEVYQRTLTFNVKAGIWASQWDGKHAIREHMLRAAGSMLENIAIASAAYSAMKLRGLDYAIGSGLECAACLDLSRAKRLLDTEPVRTEKEELSQILRMLVGLRNSWAMSARVVREKGAEYGMTGGGSDKDRDKDRDKDYKEGVLFHHESLDVYRVGIGAAVAFYSSEAVSRLSNSVYRRLDELLTSMVLNIAEGNGRFSDADQVRFLDTSHESAVKLASRLDLCVTQHLLPPGEAGEWKTLLERVSIMTRAMIAGIQRWGGRQRSRQRLRQREEEGDSEWITQCEGNILDEPQ